ncbi:1-acyl-sn-glycerol-3-phosphate acyltransferase [Saliniradius amylolyticus]|uniref:1-acyl-sn-glycerol-3-phosphate acyltransferase n=1 Tax=Saliniradius amylolyticus TaxID=2183582 RepID=UPI0013A5415F|nr:1-acyl-sn-glycerol-3-phosphate acyltransferase [Saliniradius amylolyticus]
MRRWLSFALMATLKLFSQLCYRGRPTWLGTEPPEALGEVRLVVFLNHTSLFEPLLIRMAPWHFVWSLAHKVIIPGADVTLMRPMTGRLLKWLLPGVIPITRQKDESWQHFLQQVDDQAITAILPEGRMKRANGLDKHGNPMTVRGGVADILERLDKGKMLFVYSGGLHHVQTPGERLPRLFKTLSANLEILPIQRYKANIEKRPEGSFKAKVMADMNQRLTQKVP